MNDVAKRVAQCFQSVFPALPVEQIAGASTASTSIWDSVAQVTLLSVLSEEFQVDFEVEDFERLGSYARIVEYLEGKVGDQ